MRVAIVGGGVSGLALAWMLEGEAEIVLYEREERLGGHVRTVDVDGVPAETGFKYMFESTHDKVLALIRLLGVGVRRVTTSASIRFPDGACVALPPRSLRHAAALARHSLARRGAAALGRIHLEAAKVVREADWSCDLSAFLARRFARETCEDFLVPFFAASWGFPIDVMARFSAYDVVKVVGKGWGGFLEVEGGASRYVGALARALAGVDIRTRANVRSVKRAGGALLVEGERLDHVVFAAPANVVASLLPDEPLGAACARFRYVPTEIVLHRDASWMPASRDDWGVVNYVFERGAAFVTEWCGHAERRDVFRTWLVGGRAPPDRVVHRQRFEHLVVTPENRAAQRDLARVQGERGLWAAGMYVTDVDVQESALASAIAIARRLAPRSANLRRLDQGPANARPNMSLP